MTLQNEVGQRINALCGVKSQVIICPVLACQFADNSYCRFFILSQPKCFILNFCVSKYCANFDSHHKRDGKWIRPIILCRSGGII